MTKVTQASQKYTVSFMKTDTYISPNSCIMSSLLERAQNYTYIPRKLLRGLDYILFCPYYSIDINVTNVIYSISQTGLFFRVPLCFTSPNHINSFTCYGEKTIGQMLHAEHDLLALFFRNHMLSFFM